MYLFRITVNLQKNVRFYNNESLTHTSLVTHEVFMRSIRGIDTTVSESRSLNSRNDLREKECMPVHVWMNVRSRKRSKNVVNSILFLDCLLGFPERKMNDVEILHLFSHFAKSFSKLLNASTQIMIQILMKIYTSRLMISIFPHPFQASFFHFSAFL